MIKEPTDNKNINPEPNEPRQGAGAGARARGYAVKDLYAEKIAPRLNEIKADIENGATEGQLYKKYGVGKTAFSAYKKKYPELAKVLNAAKITDKTRLVNKAHEIALGYDYTETTVVEYFDKNGVLTGSKETTVTKHAKADAGIMQFLLINKFPHKKDGDGGFARDPQILEIRRELLELKKKLATADGDEEDV